MNNRVKKRATLIIIAFIIIPIVLVFDSANEVRANQEKYKAWCKSRNGTPFISKYEKICVKEHGLIQE